MSEPYALPSPPAQRRCSNCKVSYPAELVSEFVSEPRSPRRRNWPMPMLCGICALAKTNEVHGVSQTRFDGPRAEQLRQAAIAYRLSIGLTK